MASNAATACGLPFVRQPDSGGARPCVGVTILAAAPNGAARQDAEVRFLDLGAFEARSGRVAPGPISPDDAYGGWPLP